MNEWHLLQEVKHLQDALKAVQHDTMVDVQCLLGTHVHDLLQGQTQNQAFYIWKIATICEACFRYTGTLYDGSDKVGLYCWGNICLNTIKL